jgi:hypothetical protein
MHPLRLAALLTLAAALLIAPANAAAGTYTVHTCQTPNGRWTGNAGWTSAASAPVPGYDPGSRTPCTAQGINKSLQLGSTLPARAGSWLSWDFLAPDATTIHSYAIVRAFRLAWPVVTGVANRPYLLQVWHDEDPNGGLIEFQKPLLASQSLSQSIPAEVAGDGVSWGSLHVSLSCWVLVGNLDCGPFPAQVAISRVAIGLTDVAEPTAIVTGGALLGVNPVRGIGAVSLHAFDDGGGVYRVALAVDGDEVSRRVLDAAGGACADVEPANDDPYEFAAPQPCPLSADGSVQLDTATLRDGEHAIRVTVEDVAGNEAVVLDDTIETHNAPINSTVPLLSGDARVGGVLTAAAGHWDGAPTGYSHRWLRCDADGAACAPIAGAGSSSYTADAADAYHRLRVEVTAENGSGAAVAQSGPSALVADEHGRTTPPVAGSGGRGRTGGGSGGGTTPGPVGDAGGQGIVNPLAQLPGHVANGDDASKRARLTVAFQRADGGTAHRILVRDGRRAAIVGQLADTAGNGIGGARLGVAWRVTGRGWGARPGSVRTGTDGRFVYLLPPGPSRDVRFLYFPFSDSRAGELSNVVRADALASLTIHADRRHIAGARIVGLRGHVGGGSIPRAGLLVTLQGYQRGWGWRTFRTVRTNRGGAWRTRYRFHLSKGRFGFRALVPHQGTFPFATSRSRGVYVIVS